MLEFQEGSFLRPLAIIYKRGRELSPAVRKFIEALTTSNVVPRVRGDKAERPPRGERNNDANNSDRAEKTEKPDKAEKAEKTA